MSNDSLISLTAHWLTNSFVKKSAVLHAQTLPGSHTGEIICGQYREMLAGWGIKKEQLHLIIRDNAAHMVKAMRDAAYPDLGCFTHTLQLIVHDRVLKQRSVKDTVCYLPSHCWPFQAFTSGMLSSQGNSEKSVTPTASIETRCTY